MPNQTSIYETLKSSRGVIKQLNVGLTARAHRSIIGGGKYFKVLVVSHAEITSCHSTYNEGLVSCFSEANSNLVKCPGHHL